MLLMAYMAGGGRSGKTLRIGRTARARTRPDCLKGASGADEKPLRAYRRCALFLADAP
jgi:hypothetical protein